MHKKNTSHRREGTPEVGANLPLVIIPVHRRAHIDEKVAVAALMAMGPRSKKLPFLVSIDQVRVVNYEAGEHDIPLRQGTVWSRLGKNFLIPVGVGYGPFDEHVRKGWIARAASCSQLVFDFLGISDLPWLTEVLEYANRRDQGRGRPGIMDIERIDDAIYELFPDPEEHIKDVYDSARKLSMYFQALEIRHQERQKEIPSLFDLELGDLKVRMITVTHEAQVWNAGKSDDKCDILIIHQDPKAERYAGTYQIFAKNKSAKRFMPGIAAAVRSEEIRLHGNLNEETIASMRQRLSLPGDGQARGANLWHFFAETGMVSNGGKTHRIQPSRMATNDLYSVVCRSVEEQAEAFAARPGSSKEDLVTSEEEPPVDPAASSEAPDRVVALA